MKDQAKKADAQKLAHRGLQRLPENSDSKGKKRNRRCRTGSSNSTLSTKRGISIPDAEKTRLAVMAIRMGSSPLFAERRHLYRSNLHLCSKPQWRQSQIVECCQQIISRRVAQLPHRQMSECPVECQYSHNLDRRRLTHKSHFRCKSPNSRLAIIALLNNTTR